jgi:hypothetical protein
VAATARQPLFGFFVLNLFWINVLVRVGTAKRKKNKNVKKLVKDSFSR